MADVKVDQKAEWERVKTHFRRNETQVRSLTGQFEGTATVIAFGVQADGVCMAEMQRPGDWGCCEAETHTLEIVENAKPQMLTYHVCIRAIRHLTKEVTVRAISNWHAQETAKALMERGGYLDSFDWDISEPDDYQVESVEECSD